MRWNFCRQSGVRKNMHKPGWVTVPVLVLCFLFMPARGRAQTVSVFGGSEFSHPDFEQSHLRSSDLNGWRAGVLVPISTTLSILVDADGVYGRTIPTGIVVRPLGRGRPALYTVEAGPRFAIAAHGRVSPFVEAALGVTHGRAGLMGIDATALIADTGFEGGAGGGAVVRLTPAVGLQGEFAYRRSQLFDQALNRVSVGASVIWRFHAG
jgi:hypothetical protein